MNLFLLIFIWCINHAHSSMVLRAGAGHSFGSTQVVISPIQGPYTIELYDIDDTLVCINKFNSMSVVQVDEICNTSHVSSNYGLYVVTMDHIADEYGSITAHLIVNNRVTIEHIPGTCPNGNKARCDEEPPPPPPTPTPTPTPGPSPTPVTPSNATSVVYYYTRTIYNNYYQSSDLNNLWMILFLAGIIWIFYNSSYKEKIIYRKEPRKIKPYNYYNKY